MITQTKAIVLNTLRYGENSFIAKVYTKDYGLLSLIASSGSKKDKRIKNYLSPLSQLKIAIYYKQKQSLHRLKEVDYSDKNQNIEENVAINSLKFFIAEILSKLIGEEESNENLYLFIDKQITTLNQLKNDIRYFHLDFLHELSAYLGIKPNFCEEGSYFDLREAQIVNRTPLHSDYIEGKRLILLKDYFCRGKKVKKEEISQILDVLLAFYNIHLGGLDKIKSREVLEVVFS